MCRRCGEPDKRPTSKVRRKMRQRWVDEWGNGETVPCSWGYPDVCTAPDGLTVRTLTMDRLDRGTTYRYDNCVPACQACNYWRYLKDHRIPEGCHFGPVTDIDDLAATG